VPEGRSIAPTVNSLLGLPFAVKVATRDWHPATHVSFAANHGASARPFTSTTTVRHPSDPSRGYETTLWPVHCVAGTAGAQLVPELDAGSVDAVLDKGRDARVEMYSAFFDPFGGDVEDSGLAARLAAAAVTHVFVVGLAADFCVRATAEHARELGYVTCVVEEGTRPVMPDAWPACRDALLAKGVGMVSVEGDEVAAVRRLTG
jgi:nicotinamidase-related amidase